MRAPRFDSICHLHQHDGTYMSGSDNEPYAEVHICENWNRNSIDAFFFLHFNRSCRVLYFISLAQE